MRDRRRWMDIPLLWTSYDSSLLNVVLHCIFLGSECVSVMLVNL
jgi:hypothetical protein